MPYCRGKETHSDSANNYEAILYPWVFWVCFGLSASIQLGDALNLAFRIDGLFEAISFSSEVTMNVGQATAWIFFETVLLSSENTMFVGKATL